MVNIRKHFVLTFAALKHPNYRLWFYGQLISLIGTWMQSTAQGILVYQLTSSATYLGLVSFANGVPSWFLMLYGGVIADRMPRRNLLILTQSAMMCLAFVLVILVFTNSVLPWHLIALSFLLGIANAFDAPTRLAFVAELVEKETLTNAIALNSTMFNGAAIVGPAVAGLLYAWLGAGWCFTINGLSFVAVIIALLQMKLKLFEKPIYQNSTLEQVKEGLHYAHHHDTIRIMLITLGIISFFGAGMMALIPAWAVKVLHGDAKLNGFLFSARGLGAVSGALVIATLSSHNLKGKLLMLGITTLPITLFLFALSHWAPISILIMVAMGSSFMLAVNTSNAIVQSLVSDKLRGRVMSIFTLIFFGFMPLGSLLLGIWADAWSEESAVFFCGFMLLALSIFIWIFRPHLQELP